MKIQEKNKLNSIEGAIDDIKQGKVVIVVDDEDRENEGDFIAAAEKVTPEMINFMATYGRGLICAPLTETRCEQLDLKMMVEHNTVLHHTPFTISVDLIGRGCTTGISVHDRAKTIKALVDEETKPFDLGKPGHIFPLKAKKGGVLRRTGHTEAAVDLARLAGFKPAGILVEILNRDGTMARLPDLRKIARQFDLKIISIEDLVAYRMEHDSLISKIQDFQVNTRFGDYRLRAYQETTNHRVHLALTKGRWEREEPVLTRIHSTAIGNDLLLSLTSNTHQNLDRVFGKMNEKEKGCVVLINHEPQMEDLIARLDLFKKSQQACKVVKAPQIELDRKDFGIGAQILHDLKIRKLALLSNSLHTRRVGMIGYGLEIVDYIDY